MEINPAQTCSLRLAGTRDVLGTGGIRRIPKATRGLQSPRSLSQTLEDLSETRGDKVMAYTCAVQDSGHSPHVAIECLMCGWSQWRDVLVLEVQHRYQSLKI